MISFDLSHAGLELSAKLKRIAEERLSVDDESFHPSDGPPSYDEGFKAGERQLARWILDKFEIPYQPKLK